MLATAPVKNISYYEDFAADDYYLAEGEPPGQWFGKGAEGFGLTVKVDENLSQDAISENDDNNPTEEDQ